MNVGNTIPLSEINHYLFGGFMERNSISKIINNFRDTCRKIQDHYGIYRKENGITKTYYRILEQLITRYNLDEKNLFDFLIHIDDFQDLLKSIDLFDELGEKYNIYDWDNDNSEYVSINQVKYNKPNISSRELIMSQFFSNDTSYMSDTMIYIFFYTSFEGALMDIIKETYLSNPLSLCTKKKTMTYEEIIKSKSYDKIIENLVEKQLNIINRDSIEAKFEVLFDLGIHYKFMREDLEQLIVFSTERNLFVHNNGVYNVEAITKLPSDYINRNDICEGKQIELDDIKIYNSIKLTEIVIVNVGSVVEKKFFT